MPEIDNKLLTASEIKQVTDTKVDKDFSALSDLPNGLVDTDLFNVRRSGTNYKLSALDLAPSPLVISISSGQWSGSGSDYYISITASNVNENSILIPSYDHDSELVLKGPVWCVPSDGSFTIHTRAIPDGTVTIMVQFVGTLGEAQYQVLADVYSKSQTDSAIEAAKAISGDNYFKSPNGTLIQWGKIRSGELTNGSVTAVSISLPQVYINDTYSIHALINSSTPQQFSMAYSNVAVNGFKINVYASSNFPSGAYLLWTAVGRWK